MTDRSHALRLVSVLALAGLAACAAPSSFDGLTGGAPAPKNELRTRSADPTLDAPRPISPISVSWVSTLRPTFSWKTAAGSTGAVVEMCRTRTCDGEDPRRVDVEGETLTAPEDLEPGVWFWRLYGTSKERIGTKPSVTWEIVVRGAAAKGSSDAPSGGVVDINGDGYPDLLVTTEEWGYDEENSFAWTKFPAMMIWFGQKDGKLRTGDSFTMDMGFVPGDDDAIGGGIDTDGDGFTDIVRALQDRQTGEYEVMVEYGSAGKPWEVEGAKGVDYIDFSKFGMVVLPGMTTLPVIREGGDVNGDGYGDVLVASPTAAVVGLGSAKGTSSSMPLLMGPGNGGASALIGGFDADGDGLSDVALATSRIGSPISAGRGDRERIDVSSDLVARGPGVADKAIAFASGDFNGDGIADVAATVPFDGRRHVCFWAGSRDKLFEPITCVPGLKGDDTYGRELTTGDLSGNGKDNLLATGTSNGKGYIDVFELEGDSVMIDMITDPAIGGKLTTIWPGRPGKARWATVSASGTDVLIFEGRSLFQRITTVGRGGDFSHPIRSLR